MPKRNLREAEKLQVILTLNKQQAEAINKLMATGLRGGTPSQVVLRLLDERLIEITKPS